MIQLNLFNLDLEPGLIIKPETYGSYASKYVPECVKVVDVDKEHLTVAQIDQGLRINPPEFPGWYETSIIDTYVLKGTPKLLMLPNGLEGPIRFWNGFNWTHKSKQAVPTGYSVIWDSSKEIEQSKPVLSTNQLSLVDDEGFLPSREIPPQYPGVYFATDSEHRTLKYIRAYNGSWSTRGWRKYQPSPCQDNMLWNVEKFPTREDLVNYVKAGNTL